MRFRNKKGLVGKQYGGRSRSYLKRITELGQLERAIGERAGKRCIGIIRP